MFIKKERGDPIRLHKTIQKSRTINIGINTFKIYKNLQNGFSKVDLNDLSRNNCYCT